MARKKTKNKRVLKFQMYKKQKTYRRIRFNKNKNKTQFGGVDGVGKLDLKAIDDETAKIKREAEIKAIISARQVERSTSAHLLQDAVLRSLKDEEDAIERGASEKHIASLKAATQDALNKQKTFTKGVANYIDKVDEDDEVTDVDSLLTARSQEEARRRKRAALELKKKISSRGR
jgi:hypothetical protein